MKRFFFVLILMSVTVPLLAGPATLQPADSPVIRVEEPTAADVVDVLCGESPLPVAPLFDSAGDVVQPMSGICGSWQYAGCCSNNKLRQKRNCQVGPDQWTEYRCLSTNCYT